MSDFADQLASLLEGRLPVIVESDGAEDDWNVVGPALLAAAVRHLRATKQLQSSFASPVIGWQLVRSMYEYVLTYAWIAGDPDERRRLWLKSDYEQRIKLDRDLTELGDTLLSKEQRGRIRAYVDEIGGSMSNVPDRAASVDIQWAEAFGKIESQLPEEFRRFRTLYPLIYRNGSRFTHPTTHGVDAFVSGDTPHLTVGAERWLERDLGLIATGILALGLAVAVTATPALRLTYENIETALSS